MDFGRSYSFILLLVSAILATDCSKKDTPVPTVCHLTEWAVAYPAGNKYTQVLKYNNLNQVTSTSNSAGAGVVTYAYASNGNLQTATSDDGSTAAYVYDNNDRLIQTVSSPYGGSMAVTYNGSTGQVVLVTYSDPNCSGVCSTMNYTYPNSTTHNYSETTFTNSFASATDTYTYDTHPNPLQPLLLFFPGTDNNFATKTHADSNGTSSITWTYTYDERGYPLSRTGTDGIVVTYAYNCP